MKEQLLIDSLKNLQRNGATKAEMLRQLEQYSQLKKGAVLLRAEMLVDPNTAENDLRKAHEWLTGYISLESMYHGNLGDPLGHTSAKMTVWQNPKKPSWRTPIIILLVIALAVLIGYWFKMSSNGLCAIGGVGGIVFILYLEITHSVNKEKWMARQKLSENIIRDAKRLEALIEEAGKN